jgi:hypothetical protein
MILVILRLLSLIPIGLRQRSQLALENLALRQQPAILNRRHRRPNLWRSDRLFWLLLSRSRVQWKELLVIIKAETVLRWHRPAPRKIRLESTAGSTATRFIR